MDIPNRDELEARMARVTARVLREQYKKFVSALGENPDKKRITPALLDNLRASLLEAVRPILEQTYLDQAQAVSDDVTPAVKADGLGVDFDLINERAADWAQKYGFKLVSGVTDSIASEIGEQVDLFFSEGLTIGDLRDSLAQTFGPVRAESIAVTEVTRAASEGEQAFGRELESLGLQVSYVWETSQDELVCPICGPLHKKRRGDGWTDPPPAHPRCRCWINTVVVQNG